MSKANAKYRRSVIIAVLALGTLLWVASEEYGIPRENLGWMLVYTLVAVGCVIGFAAVVAGFWIALRKLLERNSD